MEGKKELGRFNTLYTHTPEGINHRRVSVAIVNAKKLEIMPLNYKEYPENWLTEIRPAVLERAKNCCEFCGIENYTIKENRTKVVLTIAHLDHDKFNHDVDLERLKALCQKCHLQYDMPRHVANRKYGRNHDRNNYKLWN